MNKSFIFALILLMTGCTVAPESPQPTVSPLISPVAIDSPLATVQSPDAADDLLTLPTPIPDPAEGYGAMTGRLIDIETGTPIRGVAIYLANVGDVIMFQQNSSPSAMPDSEGYFNFLDVEPKSYAMVLWTPHSSFVVNNPDSDETLLLEIESDRILDLGDLRVPRP